jgi:branched-chain amino acid transport system permease protein
MPRKRWGWLAVGAVGTAAILLWPWFVGTPYDVNLLTGAAVWALFALSYDLILGWTGEVSFGHALYFGLGTYGAALLAMHTGWSSLVVAGATVVGVAVIAALLNLLTLRVSGPYFAMTTFALAEFVHLAVQAATNLTGGTNGLVGVPLDPVLTQPTVLYDVVAGVTLGLVGVVLVVKRSRWGRVAHAVRDNTVRAQLLGLPVGAIKLASLVAAAVLGALAGVFYLWFQGMAFTDVFSSNTSFSVLLMTILGGVDSAFGPAVAAAGLYVLETWLNSATVHWALVLGAIYIVVVRFFPGGLGALVRVLTRRRGEVAAAVPPEGGEAHETRG